jgi:hypothetical protein
VQRYIPNFSSIISSHRDSSQPYGLCAKPNLLQKLFSSSSRMERRETAGFLVRLAVAISLAIMVHAAHLLLDNAMHRDQGALRGVSSMKDFHREFKHTFSFPQ